MSQENLAVFQCTQCLTIVAEADLSTVVFGGDTRRRKKEDNTIEVDHLVAYENVRGRIKCEQCGETIGMEDEQGRIFLIESRVRKHVLELSKQRAAKRLRETSSMVDFVSRDEFLAFKFEQDKELMDIKEALLSMMDKIRNGQ